MSIEIKRPRSLSVTKRFRPNNKFIALGMSSRDWIDRLAHLRQISGLYPTYVTTVRRWAPYAKRKLGKRCEIGNVYYLHLGLKTPKASKAHHETHLTEQEQQLVSDNFLLLAEMASRFQPEFGY